MKKNRNTCHLTGEVLQKSYKIMKLTFIMIMGFTLASFAEGRAQTGRINFKADRIPAEMVIQQLKALTHYRFLYNHEENNGVNGPHDQIFQQPRPDQNCHSLAVHKAEAPGV